MIYYKLRLVRASAPIAGLVTKFGGQPAWLGEPQWPLARLSGDRMTFLGQVSVDAALFGETCARMAYLFLAYDDPDFSLSAEPDGGANAVVLQPGRVAFRTEHRATGPTLSAREYRTELVPDDEPKSPPRSGTELAGDKIGGTPAWLYPPSLPSGKPWRLLLQYESNVPLDFGLGDAGVLFAMIDQEATEGVLTWQTH
jgi:hypothetical protein